MSSLNLDKIKLEKAYFTAQSDDPDIINLIFAQAIIWTLVEGSPMDLKLNDLPVFEIDPSKVIDMVKNKKI